MINAAEAAKQAANTNASAGGGGGYGSASDWASIISGAGQGASSAMQSAASYANSKKEAKEAKRRTLANLMSQAMRRNTSLFRAGQEHQDDLNDYQSQAIQQAARGFVDALQGSTG